MESINPKYEVATKVYKNGIIEQDVNYEFYDERREISRRIIDTINSQFKEALIELGWTPPKEEIKEFIIPQVNGLLDWIMMINCYQMLCRNYLILLILKCIKRWVFYIQILLLWEQIRSENILNGS